MERIDAVLVISAWLLFLVMNTGKLNALIKAPKRRTAEETERIFRGLYRETALEFFVMVPASAALLILIKPVFLKTIPTIASLDSGTLRDRIAANALLGMLSYGFPFVPLRNRLSNAIQAAISPASSDKNPADKEPR